MRASERSGSGEAPGGPRAWKNVVLGLEIAIFYRKALSGALRGSPELSGALRGFPGLSEALRSSPELSGALRGSPELSGALRSSSELFGALRSGALRSPPELRYATLW